MAQEYHIAQLKSVHGANIMTASISTTYSSFSTTFQPRHECLWFGCFTNDTLMVVKGVSYFEVLDNNRLQSYTFDCNCLHDLRSATVNVVATTGKKWISDPYPSIAHMCDIMWLYAKDLVARLTWNSPTHYHLETTSRLSPPNKLSSSLISFHYIHYNSILVL